MEWTGLNQLREKYLSFFESKGHTRLPSANLIPQGDNSLLLINSGMAPLKKFFLGTETPPNVRVTTCQKCIRTPDIERVGKTARHGTYFEMLGNFSFGDYFKEEAIYYAWELLTKEFMIPKEKLAVTIFHTDDEAYNIWKKVSALPDERIIRIATKDNFWQMGDTGPCGPCSEIFYDHGPEVWGGLPGTPEEDGDRFIEIWNLVFDQFEDLPDGSRINLKKPSIDTGMGLERIAAILQGVHSNFDIDTFQHLIKAIADMANTDPKGPLQASHNVIADHLRAMSFLIADGVLPSNEGRGYVLRRIMRRAMRHVYMLGVKEPMIYKLLPVLQKEMGEAYPELYRFDKLITETIKAEETRFGKTLDKGMRLLDDETSQLTKGDTLNGETAFKLYDTYGFPLDLTQDALKGKGIEVDVAGFDAAMAKQKEEARKNWAGSGDAGTEKIWFEVKEKIGGTEFLGYKTTKSDGIVKVLVQDGKEVDSVKSGEFYLVANQTPFYGECGGQVGDTGIICGKSFKAEVYDTKRKLDTVFVHCCRMIEGEVKVEDFASFEVDETNRKQICANHSVTHLVHKALRTILGEHVTQKGSLVAADRMRFDISHPKQITADELKLAEDMVNAAIRANYHVNTVLMNQDEAVKTGAMALFGEKYGEEVRVVTMEKDGEVYSRELCGGTHVCDTGEIGYFNIISESAVSAGVRRIECVTGKGAEEYVDAMEDKLHCACNTLKTNINDLEARIGNLLEEKKKLEAEVFNLKKTLASGGAAKSSETEVVNGVKFIGKVIPDVHPKELKAFIDEMSQNIGSGVMVLATDKDGKASIVVGVTKDLTNKYSAVDLVRIASAAVGGQGGGGRPDMAQAGGPDASKLQQAFEEVKKAI